jgi:hypothetical protein
MFTALSLDTRHSDLAEQKRLHLKKLRARLRRLRRHARHAAIVQREKALIYRLLASRFPFDSPDRFLLRMLAQSSVRRMRRLETVLHELSGATTPRLPRRRLLAWKCWYARNAPRKWALLPLKHQKD